MSGQKPVQLRICDDCLEPLAAALRDAVIRLSAHQKPLQASDLEAIYKQLHTKVAADWLLCNVSGDCAAEFSRRLETVRKRLFALEFKACQILNDEVGKTETRVIQFAIQRLLNRYYAILRRMYPDGHPPRDELPDHLKEFGAAIEDEHLAIGSELLEVAEFIERLSVLVRGSRKKAAPAGPPQVSRGCQQNIIDCLWNAGGEWVDVIDMIEFGCFTKEDVEVAAFKQAVKNANSKLLKSANLSLELQTTPAMRARMIFPEGYKRGY